MCSQSVVNIKTQDRIQLFTQQNYQMEIQDEQHEKPVSVLACIYPTTLPKFNPIISAHYRFASSPRAGHPSTRKPDGNEPEKKLCSRLSPVAPFSPTLRAPIVLQHQHRQSRQLQEQLASDSHREQRQALTVSASLPAAPARWNKKAAGWNRKAAGWNRKQHVSTGTVSWFRSLWPVGWSSVGDKGA